MLQMGQRHGSDLDSMQLCQHLVILTFGKAVTFCSVNVDLDGGVTTGVKDLRNDHAMLIVTIVGDGEHTWRA